MRGRAPAAARSAANIFGERHAWRWPAPFSATWHCAHFVLKIFAPAARRKGLKGARWACGARRRSSPFSTSPLGASAKDAIRAGGDQTMMQHTRRPNQLRGYLVKPPADSPLRVSSPKNSLLSYNRALAATSTTHTSHRAASRNPAQQLNPPAASPPSPAGPWTPACAASWPGTTPACLRGATVRISPLERRQVRGRSDAGAQKRKAGAWRARLCS